MKKEFLISIMILLLFSCVRSLYPITDNIKDIVFKKELLGHWKEAKENTEYIVESASPEQNKNYKVIVLDHNSNSKKTDTSNFLVMLANIKGHYFLDCMPDTSQSEYLHIGEQSRLLLSPTHLIIKVYTIGKNSITMSAIDKDALSLLLKNKKMKIKHENISKDDILLTEKPEMLQQKLLELEHFPTIYKRDTLVRVK
jgi:hypothetical protein